MANFIDAFQPESGINLEDLVGIFAGTTDPRTGESAPIGSLWLQSTGKLYQKVGSLDTEWALLAFGVGSTVGISATDTAPGYLEPKIVVSSSLTKTVQNPGGFETLLLDLANVGIAGTYRSVTTNAKGQVTSGSNPTTLSGYGITDAQGLNVDLTALAQTSTTGLYTITGSGTSATRTIVGSATQVVVTNGNGVAGNPTLAFATSGLTFPGTEGIFLPFGDTTQRVDILGSTRLNSDTFTIEYYNGTAWVSLVASTGGTVTSVAVTVPAGLSVTGSPITTSGTLAFSLANDLAAVEGLSTLGLAARTATDTWTTRTLTGTTSRLTVTDGDGIAGNPTFDIASDYVGQSSITTLGIITTGTWGATTIGTEYGGTGRTTIGSANSVLGVSTSGTNLEYKSIQAGTAIQVQFGGGSITLNNTGVTSLTGTANQVIASGSTGAVTLSLPQSIGTTSTPTFSTLTLSGPITNANQAVTKAYVDGAVQGLSIKEPVRAGTTAQITLSGEQTIDNVPVVSGDRVLVKNQTAPAENGIYYVTAGAWTRTLDQDVWTEVPAAFTFISEGDTLAETGWISTANAGGTIGTTAMPWVQFSSAGIILAGTGLTKTGNVLSITNTGVTPGVNYNRFTVNAQGQITAADAQPYLTANQNITLQGDVTGGPAPNLLTTSLSLTGVTAGTYQSVTVDAKGRVTGGTNPTTLAEYFISDAQPLDADLTALAGFTGVGIAVRTAADTWALRSITVGSSKLSLSNADGSTGNPVLDVVESEIHLNNLDGTLSPTKGGTGLVSLGSANTLLGISAAGTAAEYKTLTSSGITITHTQNGIDFATVNNGTVTSVAVTGSTGLSVSGSPITSSGTISLTLGAELQGLSTLSSLGLVTRTAVGTYVERTVVSGAGTISISNPAGTTGNIGLDLATIGTAGTYYSVTTDNFGRVTSGGSSVPWNVVTSTPITLAGYGITDAQPLNSFLTSVSSNVNTGIVVKNGGNSLVRSIVAGSARISVVNGDGIAGNPTVDLGSVALGDLSNVSVSSPVTGQSLVYNGSIWTAASVTPKLYAENAVFEVTPVSTGTNAIALGSAATAGAHDSLAFGPQSLSRLPGIVQANGRFGTQGDAQHGTYILRSGTINAIPTELFLDGTNGSERLTMTTDTTWVWKATIVAHRVDADDHAGFELSGVIYCGGSLNSITMLGAVTRTILARSDSNLNVSATADTATGSLKLTVTGGTGKTIRWTAVVQTTEVTN